MPERKDYYGTLGVPKSATPDDIRKAYRRMARKYHPDLNPGDKAAEDMFKKVQEAHDILSDEKKRKVYDQLGYYTDQAMPGGGPFGQGAGPGFGFEGFDFSDFMNQQGRRGQAGPQAGRPENMGGGNFGDIFSQFFGGRQQAPKQRQPETGSDLEYTLNIDFWQSVKGTQAKMNVQRQESCETCGGSGSTGKNITACPECDGSGQVSQVAGAMRFNLTCPRCQGSGRLRNVCTTCHGEGRLLKNDLVEMRVPQGVSNGTRLRVAGKGNAGTMGAPAGDLFITVKVQEHPFFKREGDNVEIKVPVTVAEAVLGAKIEVPTIDGRALLKIPMGTQNGQKFRLRERGIFNSRRETRGDQVVEVVLQAPSPNDERTRELLRELAELHPGDPRESIWSQL